VVIVSETEAAMALNRDEFYNSNFRSATLIYVPEVLTSASCNIEAIWPEIAPLTWMAYLQYTMRN
jgi:hypothetical protein